jgi:hypothetical protein
MGYAVAAGATGQCISAYARKRNTVILQSYEDDRRQMASDTSLGQDSQCANANSCESRMHGFFCLIKYNRLCEWREVQMRTVPDANLRLKMFTGQ